MLVASQSTSTWRWDEVEFGCLHLPGLRHLHEPEETSPAAAAGGSIAGSEF